MRHASCAWRHGANQPDQPWSNKSTSESIQCFEELLRLVEAADPSSVDIAHSTARQPAAAALACLRAHLELYFNLERVVRPEEREFQQATPPFRGCLAT